MARPNVTVTIVDNSFIVAGTEAGSTHVSGMFSLTTPSLVTLFGTTAEKDNGYMQLNTLGDWMAKLNGTTYGGTAGQGPTGDWKVDWYSAYNNLTYGGSLIIAGSSSALNDTTILVDTVFTSSLSETQASAVTAVTEERGDIIGIVGVTYAGYQSGGTVVSGVTASFADNVANSNVFLVGGEKVMLGLSNTTVGENFVTIPLASDAAGCFARTDRDATLWSSPAGLRRGRILNTIRLIKNPKSIEQDYLYNSKINSVIGIPGQGTFLFGDITKESVVTSTLTRVNVVRCINYIRRVLTNTANSVLFELNDSITRSQFSNAAESFLQRLVEGRGLTDFRVVCDETNNPASVVDANQFVADIFIKPTKSVNFVKITITNVNSDAQI